MQVRRSVNDPPDHLDVLPSGQSAAPTVRKITLHDLEAVVDLWGMFVTESNGPPLSFDRWGPGVSVPYEAIEEAVEMPDEPSKAVRQGLTAMLQADDDACYVAYLDEKVVGFVVVELRRHRESECITGIVEELYVRPDHRRRSIGTRLLRQAITCLRRAGATTIQAVVPKDALAARPFLTFVGLENDLDVWSLYQ
jgi:ribosomal protein S18 acetylase RimI-like enzyme